MTCPGKLIRGPDSRGASVCKWGNWPGIGNRCHLKRANLVVCHTSMNINSNSEGQPKRQIVVCALLGWAGASPRHLQKYSTMVKQEWNAVGDLTCIESVMPVAYIFSPLPWPRRHWATELLESISETAAECDSPVILLYAFSNGGAFVVEQLCTLLQEPSNSRYIYLLLIGDQCKVIIALAFYLF